MLLISLTDAVGNGVGASVLFVLGVGGVGGVGVGGVTDPTVKVIVAVSH